MKNVEKNQGKRAINEEKLGVNKCRQIKKNTIKKFPKKCGIKQAKNVENR